MSITVLDFGGLVKKKPILKHVLDNIHSQKSLNDENIQFGTSSSLQVQEKVHQKDK